MCRPNLIEPKYARTVLMLFVVNLMLHRFNARLQRKWCRSQCHVWGSPWQIGPIHWPQEERVLHTLSDVYPAGLRPQQLSHGSLGVSGQNPWWDPHHHPQKPKDMSLPGSILSAFWSWFSFRYNIPLHDQKSANPPYQFIFNHLQVINDVKDFCDWADLNINNKRPHSPNGVTPAASSHKCVHIMDDRDNNIEVEEELWAPSSWASSTAIMQMTDCSFLCLAPCPMLMYLYFEESVFIGWFPYCLQNE